MQTELQADSQPDPTLARLQADRWTSERRSLRTFIEDEIDAPKHLAREIHHEYFEPVVREFAPRTKWSLQSAFTSGLKLLEPVPQFKATSSFGEYFDSPSLESK
jgi:hypothetical protein